MVGAMRHPFPSTVVAPGGPEGRRPRLPLAAECQDRPIAPAAAPGPPDPPVAGGGSGGPSRELNVGDPTPLEELDQRRLV